MIGKRMGSGGRGTERTTSRQAERHGWIIYHHRDSNRTNNQEKKQNTTCKTYNLKKTKDKGICVATGPSNQYFLCPVFVPCHYSARKALLNHHYYYQLGLASNNDDVKHKMAAQLWKRGSVISVICNVLGEEERFGRWGVCPNILKVF